MARNTGLTDKVINHMNRHGSISVDVISKWTDRTPSKVAGDVNESLRNNGEEMFIAREGNRYYYYTEAKAA